MEVQSLYQTNLRLLQSNYLFENFSYYVCIVEGTESALMKLQLFP